MARVAQLKHAARILMVPQTTPVRLWRLRSRRRCRLLVLRAHMPPSVKMPVALGLMVNVFVSASDSGDVVNVT